MAQNSFALMTNLGRAKEAAALANGTAIVITHIAIGDGSTVPSGGETALYNEVARKAISGHGTVVGAANTAYFDIFLAAADGPYTIREAGLYDSAGDLIAIARYDPPISKPVPSSGQTVEGTVRLQVAFSNIANITIVVDPSFTVPLQRLSRLPWFPVLSMSVTAPPASPALGDAYLVPTGSTGSWAGQSGKVAEYTSAGWSMISPPDGHGISLPDGRVFERVAGTYVEKIALDAQSGKWFYATAGGTAAILTATLSPVPQALVDGMSIIIRPTVNVSTGATLNINSLGAKPLLGGDGAAVRAGDMIAGAPVIVIYSQAMDAWVLVTSPRILSQIVGFKANTISSFTLAALVKTTAIYTSKAFDTTNGYNVATGEYTIQRAGVYSISANGVFSNTGIDAPCYIFIVKNGAQVAESSHNYRARVLSVSTLEQCAVGDKIKVQVQQDSGSVVTIPSGSYQHTFSATLVGNA
ncbi:DUF2793 domain-containing protein [Brucella anthropi]|uniref:phage tail-collar fiber domain-containing protein n=1 Tax=Brucella anthropi TaxID=529 RepID=UPI00124C63BF|nr:phage tail protein [Brucella anthropi]KAB2738541.1 DUF2793 domain-containing protein [Brucella anthropi]